LRTGTSGGLVRLQPAISTDARRDANPDALAIPGLNARTLPPRCNGACVQAGCVGRMTAGFIF